MRISRSIAAWVWAGGVMAAATTMSMPVRAEPPPHCAADCSDDGRVSIDELVLAVAIALARAPRDACVPADADADGRVTIDELIAAVGAAQFGCPPPGIATTTAVPPATATAAQTATLTATASTATPQPNFILINLDDTRADGIDRMSVVETRLIGAG